MKIFLSLLAVYIIWGTSYLAIKIGVSQIPPMLFCSLRYLIAAPLLLLIALFRQEQIPASLHNWFWLVITSLLIAVIPGALIAWAQQFISSQITALLMSSACLWVALFGSLGRTGQRLTPTMMTGLLLGFISLFMLTDIPTTNSPSLSHIAVLVAALIFSVGTLLFKRFVATQQIATAAAIHLAIAGGIMLAISVMIESPPDWQASSVMALLYLAIVNSVMTLMLYYWLIHNASPALIGTPNMVVPAVAILSGTLLSNELLNQQQVGGAALMLLALLLMMAPSIFIFASNMRQR